MFNKKNIFIAAILALTSSTQLIEARPLNRAELAEFNRIVRMDERINEASIDHLRVLIHDAYVVFPPEGIQQIADHPNILGMNFTVLYTEHLMAGGVYRLLHSWTSPTSQECFEAMSNLYNRLGLAEFKII